MNIRGWKFKYAKAHYSSNMGRGGAMNNFKYYNKMNKYDQTI